MTWIVVADASRARVLEPRATDGALAETDVFERIHPRVGAAETGGSIAAAPWPWIAGPEYDAFTQAIARHLALAHASGRFSRLVLVARGPILKTLYAALSPGLRTSVGLLAEADLIDAEAGIILSCLPGRIEHFAQLDA